MTGPMGAGRQGWGIRGRAARAIAVAALLLFGAACAQEAAPDPAPAVEVGGLPGQRPEVSFATPFPVSQTVVATVIEGDGPEVVDGAAVLLSYLAVNASDGQVIADGYHPLPQTRLATEEELGSDLYSTILGSTEGSRLLRVESGTATRPQPIVMVIDVLRSRAHGEAMGIPDGLPAVQVAENGRPTIAIPAELTPPATLTVQTLVRGAGPQVKEEHAVTFQFTAMNWNEDGVVDSTWDEGRLPESMNLSDALPGWRMGLVDQTVGSQVLMLIPPELGNGYDTLVVVVDILAVSDEPVASLDGTDHVP